MLETLQDAAAVLQCVSGTALGFPLVQETVNRPEDRDPSRPGGSREARAFFGYPVQPILRFFRVDLAEI